MRIEGMTQERTDLYNEGKRAHADGLSKDACTVGMRKKCWWLAGWIDADIESGKSIWGNYGKSN